MFFVNGLLYLLAAIFSIILLVLLVLSVSVGVNISNAEGSFNATAKWGIFWYKITRAKKKKSDTSNEKVKAKKIKKELKAEKKKQKKTSRKPAKVKSYKKIKERKKQGVIQSLLLAALDYDYEYLKIIKIKKIKLMYICGGINPADIGKKYAHVSEIIGIGYPLITRVLNIKKHQIRVYPDFINKKSNFVFEMKVRLRPIKVMFAAFIYYKAYKRNLATFNLTSSQKALTIKSKYHKYA